MADVFPGAANFFRRIVNHPCARPWYIYVETFLPAFVELFILISIPLADDIIRARGESHVRGAAASGRRRYTHTRAYPVYERESKQARWQRGALRTIIKVTDPLETIGFTWLLLAGGDRFFWRWASLIENSAYCTRGTESGPFSRSRTGGVVDVGPGGRATGLPDLEQNRAGWTNTSFDCNLPTGPFFCGFQATIQGPHGGINGVQARLTIFNGFTIRHVDGGKIDIAEGEWATVGVDADFHVLFGFDGSITWQLDGPAVPVGLLCQSASVFCWRSG